MKKKKYVPFKKKTLVSSMLVGVICMIIFLGLSGIYYFQYNRQISLRMEHVYKGVQTEIYETLQAQMAKLKVMEGHLVETGGDFQDFGPIADRILNNEPEIRSFIFAPDNISSGAFPLEGNEDVIGFDFNSDDPGNAEAKIAINTGTLTLAGPFPLVEGGDGVCGRLPIYLDDENGESKYWGLVTCTLNFPDIFTDSMMDRINEQGYACRIWRISPDTNEEQTILETKKPIQVKPSKVTSHEVEMFNATWYFDFAPLNYNFITNAMWLCFLVSLAVSFIIARGVYLDKELKYVKVKEHELRIHNLQQELDKEHNNRLLTQISSHFFYHTLNSLQTLILLQPDMAVKMAGDFARYLRFNVDVSVNVDGVGSFKEEIRAVKAYAAINEVQLGDRLKVIFDIPDVDFQIPALTIEPIVENAILHGVKPKPEGGIVTVSLVESEDEWEVIIQDNGMGFDVEASKNERSIGLNNVKKRIERFKNCSIKIESIVNNGTTVYITYSKNI